MYYPIRAYKTNKFIIFHYPHIFICFKGPLYPSNHALWGHWAPVLERTWLFSLATAGANIAYFSFYIISGYLCDSSFLGGWPSAVYVSGK